MKAFPATQVADVDGFWQPRLDTVAREAIPHPLARTWSPGHTVEVQFQMPVAVRRAHPKVRSVRGQVAVTRGPMVYCLESPGNPVLDLFQARLDPSSVRGELDPDLLGGIWVLRGRTAEGQAFTAIPYAFWANRGESQMAVWVGV